MPADKAPAPPTEVYLRGLPSSHARPLA
jgi:hypothetical protein